ncbi:hypothetical protein FACS1894111_09270 [Clostridia bacterium]|nr:hypothetical protein FACS1894111_09270 [Clostridia bacterium]
MDQQKKKQKKEEAMLAAYEFVMQSAGLAFWRKNAQQDSLVLSDSVQDLWGYKADFFEHKLSTLETIIPPPYVARMHRAKEDYQQGKTKDYRCDFPIRAQDGTERWVRSKGLFVDPEKKEEMFGTFLDISEFKEDELRLKNWAYHDFLTGAYTLQYLASAYTFSPDVDCTSCGGLMVNVRDFHRINDVYGYQSGDDLLVVLAVVLGALMPGNKLVRVSADCFLAVFENPTEMQMTRTAEKILKRFSSPIRARDFTMNIEINMGIIISENLDLMNLLKNAEIALAWAKKSHEHYCIMTKELLSTIEKRMNLEDELKKAIGRHEFVMYYQPKVSLREKKPIAAEALIRWIHPEVGMVPPLDFIPLAEETGMIAEIGEFIIWDVIRQTSKWYQEGLDLKISLNLSVKQFNNPKLVDYILDTLEQFQLPPEHLSLELLESVMVTDFTRIKGELERLRSHGCKIELDDFGTGYSAMSYLTRMPIDFLKVDKSYIDYADKEEADRAILESILYMAHRLGFIVVAEGVETKTQLDVLKEFGCDLIQGYYYSRPLPAEEFHRFVTEWKIPED